MPVESKTLVGQRTSLCFNVMQVTVPLTWDSRVYILLGVSRGLAYLHSEVPPVIHHDINRHVTK